MLFSGKYNFSLQVFFDEGTCGESEPESLDVTLKEGNRLYGTAVLSPVEPLNAVAFEWFAEDDAVHNLTAALSAPFEKTKSGFSVSASPLGFFPDGEGISVSLDNNRKLAGSFEVENAVRVKSVELKMRRLRDFSTGEFLVQIRPDAGGKPGGDEETGTRRGISILPSSTGAVRIDLPPGSALQPGRHWLVVAGMSSESFEIEALNATVTGGMQAVANPLQAGAEDWKPWSHALFFKVSGLPS